jgi:hypothetical protein
LSKGVNGYLLLSIIAYNRVSMGDAAILRVVWLIYSYKPSNSFS